jgi:hypothetical protein
MVSFPHKEVWAVSLPYMDPQIARKYYIGGKIHFFRIKFSLVSSIKMLRLEYAKETEEMVLTSIVDSVTTDEPHVVLCAPEKAPREVYEALRMTVAPFPVVVYYDVRSEILYNTIPLFAPEHSSNNHTWDTVLACDDRSYRRAFALRNMVTQFYYLHRLVFPDCAEDPFIQKVAQEIADQLNDFTPFSLRDNFQLVIEGVGWGPFIQKNAHLSNISFVTLLSSALTASPHLILGRQASHLALTICLCGAFDESVVAATVRNAINLRELSILDHHNLKCVLENNTVQEVDISPDSDFRHIFPFMTALEIGVLDVSICFGTCPRLSKVSFGTPPRLLAPEDLSAAVIVEAYVKILEEVPTLTEEPLALGPTLYRIQPPDSPESLDSLLKTMGGDFIRRGEMLSLDKRIRSLAMRRHLLSIHAPHILPVFEFNNYNADDNYDDEDGVTPTTWYHVGLSPPPPPCIMWSPRLHARFGPAFNRLAAVFLMACEFMQDNGLISPFNPAALEYTLRHFDEKSAEDLLDDD